MITKTRFLFNSSRSFSGTKEASKDKTYNMIELLEIKKDHTTNKLSFAKIDMFIDKMPDVIATLNCFDLIECTIDVEMSGKTPRLNLVSVDKIIRKSTIDIAKLMI